jgi:tyrosine-protein phosphatase YwqE
MFNIFKKQNSTLNLPFQVDVHSHLIPGLDDGVKTEEESLYILREFIKLGYKKVITTPHVKGDQYPNKAEEIEDGASAINARLKSAKLPIKFEAAAEYFLDDTLFEMLQNNDRLLTFGDRYLLFETSFLNKPAFLEAAIFQMNINGYKPVFAHPERYIYLQSEPKTIVQLKDMNVRFQVNLLSLSGYYSQAARKLALRLIYDGHVDFIGSDCHNAKQANEIVRSVATLSNRILRQLQVKNESLL